MKYRKQNLDVQFEQTSKEDEDESGGKQAIEESSLREHLAHSHLTYYKSSVIGILGESYLESFGHAEACRSD